MAHEHTHHIHKEAKRMSKLKIFLIGLLVVIVLSGIIFAVMGKLSKQRELERKVLGMEAAVNGTPIMATREAIKEAIASGKETVTKDVVLYSKSGNDYVCTIETDKGIITLKKRGDLMREDMMREKKYNTSVIFNDGSLYIYHPIYLKWLRFDYAPDMGISNTGYLYSAFSFSELAQINETKYDCIQMDLPQNEFSLGDIEVFDAQQALERGSPFTKKS